MTKITLLNDVEVKLVDSAGGDYSAVRAARVSVVGENSAAMNDKDQGLINYLLREKHGSPFEHNSMTFFVKCPIFAAREFMRHRVGFSYNEMSGRYTKLEAEFYLPDEDRPLVNAGKSSKPYMVEGDEYQKQFVHFSTAALYQHAWDTYEEQLEMGIANEVAREVLPVGVMTQFYVTVNARSIMNFLSLRTHDASAAHVSHPQFEIEMVAREIEKVFAKKFPVTYAAFHKYGRIAP